MYIQARFGTSIKKGNVGWGVGVDFQFPNGFDFTQITETLKTTQFVCQAAWCENIKVHHYDKCHLVVLNMKSLCNEMCCSTDYGCFYLLQFYFKSEIF